MNEHNLIDQYEVGGERLRNAIKELKREDLLCVPDPKLNVGKWSIHQVVIHLQDAELAFAHRIKRVLAEDDPAYNAWDENRFVERLEYHEQSAEDAVAIIDLTRKQLTRVLRKLGPSALERAGTHAQRGRQTVRDILNYAVPHLEHHLKFIVAKREAYGKVMW
jgi:uncharacterized damage-inducible protein DinB